MLRELFTAGDAKIQLNIRNNFETLLAHKLEDSGYFYNMRSISAGLSSTSSVMRSKNKKLFPRSSIQGEAT